MPYKSQALPPTAPSFMGHILHEIKETLRTEPHSLNEIKQALVDPRTAEMDFLKLIERHHDYLHESISVLLDASAAGQVKQLHLTRLLYLVEMHGKAEQEVLYNALLNCTSQTARLEGLSGLDEHEIAFQLVADLERMHAREVWTEEIAAKAKVLAIVYANHMQEEEAQILPIARENLNRAEMHELTREYLRLCQIHLDVATSRKPQTLLMT